MVHLRPERLLQHFDFADRWRSIRLFSAHLIYPRLAPPVSQPDVCLCLGADMSSAHHAIF